jgi:UDPglucose 6-dehydrogenase
VATFQKEALTLPKEHQVCVIGLWHLGSVTAACLAEMGYSVIGVDEDATRIAKLNVGTAPLFEPGLDVLLQQGLASGRLRFTTDYADGLRGSSCVWLAYDTTVNERDEVDLKIIIAAAEKIAQDLKEDAVLIVHSQVPVGTCEQIESVVRSGAATRPFGIACIPENLRLGNALECFRKPAMLVIGSNQEATIDRVEAFCSMLPCRKLRMNLRSAEMTKHAINCYLATCISYINELANLCDAVGANASMVSAALRMDERVSPRAPLLPGGLGFAGATLARDLRALQALGKRVAHPTQLFNAVLEVNEEQKRIVYRRLNALFGSLERLTVGILGLTYKTGTSTLRRSAAIEIARGLKSAGATVKAYDPHAATEELCGEDTVQFCSSADEAAADSSALVIATEWPEFKDLDFAALGARMKHRVLIDTKNLLEPDRLRALGYTYSDIGRGTLLEWSETGLNNREMVCG